MTLLLVLACIPHNGPSKPDSPPSDSPSTTDITTNTTTDSEPPDSAPNDSGKESQPDTRQTTPPDNHRSITDLSLAKLTGEGSTAYGSIFSIADGSDMDGDGQTDIVVGLDDGYGKVYIFHGPVSGQHSLGQADGLYHGRDAASSFPCGDRAGTVATGGDANGDGLEDLLVGAWQYCENSNLIYPGRAYLLFNPANGTHLLDDDADTIFDAEYTLNEDGIAVGMTGVSLSFVGDTDGDGMEDLLIGAPTYSQDGGFAYGVAYLVKGPVLPGIKPLSEVTDRILGAHDVAYDMGAVTGSAGDVNGDGLSDILIGYIAIGPGGNEGMLLEGPVTGTLTLADADATIYDPISEGAEVRGAGDLNGDGYDDLVAFVGGIRGKGGVAVLLSPSVGARETTTGEAQWEGEMANGGLGRSVCVPGDLNGDGAPDLAFGGEPGAGGVYLEYGPFAGVESAEDADVILMGNGTDGFGWSLAAAGDLDGDGRGDLLVSAPWDADGGTNAGAVWLVSSSGL